MYFSWLFHTFGAASSSVDLLRIYKFSQLPVPEKGPLTGTTPGKRHAWRTKKNPAALEPPDEAVLSF
jgi:hypothetical protein